MFRIDRFVKNTCFCAFVPRSSLVEGDQVMGQIQNRSFCNKHIFRAFLLRIYLVEGVQAMEQVQDRPFGYMEMFLFSPTRDHFITCSILIKLCNLSTTKVFSPLILSPMTVALSQYLWQGSNPRSQDYEPSVLPLCHYHWSYTTYILCI